MKVCMLSIADAGQPYGSTTRPMFLGNHLVRLGINVIHICEKLHTDGQGPRIISRQDFPNESEKMASRHLIQHCRQFSPDLVYSHQVYPAKLGRKLSRSLKRIHVYDAHSSLAQELSIYAHVPARERLWRVAYEWVTLLFSDRIIAPSVELRDYFVRIYHIRPEKIRIVKNGVETRTFKPGRPDPLLKQSLGIPSDATVVLFTNPRIDTFPSNEMALRMLFRLIPEIERKIANVRFLILGGGTQIAAPSRNVIYTGYVNNLPAYLNLADVCVGPYPPEAVCGGTRNKICEYLACGKPIVATSEAMRGFDDAIDGEHFLLAGDEMDFVAKLQECIQQPGRASALGRNARQLSEKYDWNHLAGEVVAVFEEAARDRKSPIPGKNTL